MLAAMAEKAQLAGALSGGHPSAGLSLKKVTVELGEPLQLEIEAFLQAVRERTRPVVSGEDGRAALALALEINEAIAVHAERAGLGDFL
jgi:predicted dehydrogenase